MALFHLHTAPTAYLSGQGEARALAVEEESKHDPASSAQQQLDFDVDSSRRMSLSDWVRFCSWLPSSYRVGDEETGDLTLDDPISPCLNLY